LPQNAPPGEATVKDVADKGEPALDIAEKGLPPAQTGLWRTRIGFLRLPGPQW
jgi:hypothetical protein